MRHVDLLPVAAQVQDEDPETFGRREPKGGGWIELSRAELRDKRRSQRRTTPHQQRLLSRPAAPIPAPTPDHRPAIRISVNGAASGTPQVRAEADIAAVLRAVASL